MTIKITAEMVRELRDRTNAPMMACKKALEEAEGHMDNAVDILRKAGEARAAKRAGKIAAEGTVIIAVSDDKKKAFMVEINSETDFVARGQDFLDFANKLAALGLEAATADIEKLLSLQMDATQTVEASRQALVSKLGENIQVRRAAFMTSDGMVGHYRHGHRIGVLVAIDKHNPDIAKDVAMHIAAFNPQAISGDQVSPELINREKEIIMAQSSESGKPREIVEKMVQGRLTKYLKEISLLDQAFFKDPNVIIADLLKPHQVTVKQFVRFELAEGIEKEVRNFADEVKSQLQGNH